MRIRFGRRSQAIAWLLLAGVITAVCANVFFRAEDKTWVMPGETSHGHYQIELECSVCHDTKPDGLLVSAVSNKACLACHDQDLEDADDSHPVVKFKKPENRPFLEKIDAMSCVACHTEHEPEATGAMGVTLPADYCTYCHQTTVEERETHKGLGFDTCATAGCHNFHDNRALYERHLALHSVEPPMLEAGQVGELGSLAAYLKANRETKALAIGDADAPTGVDMASHAEAWSQDAHALAGVNCSDCHQPEGVEWSDSVSVATCGTCHDDEKDGFFRGKHGMRIAAGLSPMTPGAARQPMKAEAAHRALDCTSCHAAHDFDTRRASYASCVECHDDDHTKAYVDSPHFAAWERELSGAAPAGSGVSCATCHMPRVDDGRNGLRVEHNQNANLTPNEKMLRAVCQQCHGLPFAMDALADRELIDRNFTGKPEVHVESCDWSRQRAIDREDPEILELIRQMTADPSPEPNNTD
ncbi:NrfA- nitrite reduction protein [Haloferula helveola]|uniref:nitrite reductase (cytochrome; ammonia-forming) n=1 Tax=Haloferula helveola TaxID=490095 RepID=A0ABM7RJF8_9BACT|nr:NrfA- nitrite reduction protein [Haloferula helveola]